MYSEYEQQTGICLHVCCLLQHRFPSKCLHFFEMKETRRPCLLKAIYKPNWCIFHIWTIKLGERLGRREIERERLREREREREKKRQTHQSEFKSLKWQWQLQNNNLRRKKYYNFGHISKLWRKLCPFLFIVNIHFKTWL